MMDPSIRMIESAVDIAAATAAAIIIPRKGPGIS